MSRRLHVVSAGAFLSATIVTAALAATVADRKPIYDEKADARALIDQAVRRAKAENKHVLIQWGGNWCGWCYKLHDLFQSDEEINRVLTFEYEVVMVDSNTNEALAKSMGTKFEGVPYLTVLDANGKKLTDQDTAALEEGDHHAPAKVLEFLNKWRPASIDAYDVLKAAQRNAATEGKLVFVRFSTPTCGWCKRLDAFLETDAAKRILAPRYVFAKIDQARMIHGDELRRRLGSRDGGVPWFAFTDADGKSLATSDGPEGNIGFPAQPREIGHFLKMVKQTYPGVSQPALDEMAEYFRAHGH
jgi:thioredoxin-related protein